MSWRIPFGRLVFATTVCVLVTAGMVAAQRPSWLGHDYLRPAVYGRVVDAERGTPVSGLGIESSAMVGITSTDSAGWFVLFDLRPGDVTITFRCPSERRFMFARRFTTRRVTIAPATDSSITFRVPMDQCIEPPSTDTTGIFLGTLEAEFERFEFIPCRAFPTFPGTAYEGLTPRVAVSLADRLREKPIAWPETDGSGTKRFFVRWHGTVSGPGGYGHLSQSLYGLVVDSIISVEPGTNTKCPQDAR